jgi:kynurenine 3-monooxygenase
VLDFFETHFPDAKALMPDLSETFFNNPTDSLVTIRCDPWHYQDKACLLGDAAHAIVPFYGQGMNAGFEDCMVLNDLMESNKDQSWGALFHAFSKKRVKDGHAIADLALYNYVEMRDLVADMHFLRKQEISRKIHTLYPDYWQPLYTMVTFSRLPYSEAKARGDRQDQILENLLAKYSYETLIDEHNLAEAVAPYLGIALPKAAKPDN